MRRRRMLALVTGLGAVSVSVVAGAVPASAKPASWHFAQARSCAAATGHDAACNALLRVRVSSTGKTSAATATPDGFGPADLQSAYSLPSSTAGAGQTVAIVDAYNDPSAEALQVIEQQGLRTKIAEALAQSGPTTTVASSTTLPAAGE